MVFQERVDRDVITLRLSQIRVLPFIGGVVQPGIGVSILEVTVSEERNGLVTLEVTEPVRMVGS